MEKKEETCKFCAGTGNTVNVFDKTIKCPVCNGTGKIEVKK